MIEKMLKWVWMLNRSRSEISVTKADLNFLSKPYIDRCNVQNKNYHRNNNTQTDSADELKSTREVCG